MNFSLKQFNRCDYYVLIWCLYQMQGLLYPQGIIGQALQALLIIWALVEAKEYFLPNRRNPVLLKATSILMFMFCMYGAVLMLDNQTGRESPHTYLQAYLVTFLPVFLFYRYLKEGYLTEERLRNYIWIFLSVAIWTYYKYERETIAKLRQLGSSREEITNNAGYEFLSLIPITFFFYKKTILQYSLLCIALLFIVMAMKRGPILIGVLCFIWTLIINIKAAGNRKQRYATILLGIVIVLLAITYVIYQLNNSDYFNQRIESTKDGNMSRRDILYLGAIDLIINDTSIFHLFLGRGAWATYKLLGNFAHQDWLEIGVCNGFVGLSIFFYFCSTFLYTVIKCNGIKSKQIYTSFLMSYLIFIFKTIFSMSMSYMPYYQSMLIAFCIYYCDKKKCIKENT